MTLLQSRGPSLDELCSAHPAVSSRALPPSLSEVYDVQRCSNPHVGKKSRASAAQLAGLRYEKRAIEFLSSRWPGQFVDHPWFAYRRLRDHTRRYCQPDGFVSQEGTLVIFEVKIRWCPEAASQLFLYRDVVLSAVVHSAVRLVCVTRSFDPSVRHEGRATIVDSLEPSLRDSAPKEPLGEGAIQTGNLVEVFIWKP